MLEEVMDEMNRVTIAYIEAHPFDPDAYYRYIMSDDWKPRMPFIYKDEEKS